MSHRWPEHRFYQRLLELLEEGRHPYLCRVVEATGSAPRNPGAQMMVLPGGAIEFTLGGGSIEGQVIRQALLSFDAPKAFLREYHLGDLGMHCGGIMRVLFDPTPQQDLHLYRAACDLIAQRQAFALVLQLPEGESKTVHKALLAPSGLALGQATLLRSARPLVKDLPPHGVPATVVEGLFIQWVLPPLRLLIFGAGHVGSKLAEVAAATGVFEVHIVDDRAAFADPQKLPFCQTVRVVDENYEGPLPLPDERTFVAVITRCHATDLVVVRHLLSAKSPFAYLGMIGSVPKRARLFKMLQQEGVSSEQLAQVTTPMGLPIGGKDPGEIALSMLAQMIQRKNNLAGTLEGGMARWQRKRQTKSTL